MELIEYKEMREAIQRVRELHKTQMSKDNCVHNKDYVDSCAACGACNECLDDYPCPTIKALDGESTIKERLNRSDQAIPVKLEEL